MQDAQIRRALANLRYHWTDTSGQAAYLFRHDGARYIATRTDDGTELAASEPAELWDRIRDDYAARPVSRP
jgi:hypothetical protein